MILPLCAQFIDEGAQLVSRSESGEGIPGLKVPLRFWDVAAQKELRLTGEEPPFWMQTFAFEQGAPPAPPLVLSGHAASLTPY